MKKFTGWEWLLIDAATQYGLDKQSFENRLAWANSNLEGLEGLLQSAEAKTRPQYQKAVMAIRRAAKGLPTGHLVGVDAACSGLQIMSVLTGCLSGAKATGLVDPDKPADAYGIVTETMADMLGQQYTVERADAKRAVMTSFYGSTLVPKEVFGEDTPELAAFYEAAQKVAPGAWELLQDLLSSWRPYALEHSWKMPDGFDVKVKVLQQQECRIEVDELDHSTFTHTYYTNEGSKTGLSNAANVVHSVDAYVCRSMHRRCNYDLQVVTEASEILEITLLERALEDVTPGKLPDKIRYYMDQYERSSMADPVILPYLTRESAKHLTTKHLLGLSKIVNDMLSYKPFELVSIHDEYKSHANNVNQVRFHYKEILAELADSEVLKDLLEQLYGFPGNVTKLSNNLGSYIRSSNYALC